MAKTSTAKGPRPKSRSRAAIGPPLLTEWMREQVGLRLKALRKRRKMTASALASACLVGPGQVFRWEAGDNELTFTGLARAADALECSINDLFPPTSKINLVRKRFHDHTPD